MNCTIRPWRMSDAMDLAAALSDPAILNNLRDGLPYPYTEKDAEDYITAMLCADKSAVFAYAICLEDRAVGSIGAFRQSNIHFRTAELGYYLAREYWGRGIVTEAVRQSICANGYPAHLCGAVFRQCWLPPGAGEGGLSAGGNPPQKRLQERPGAGYGPVRSDPPAGGMI